MRHLKSLGIILVILGSIMIMPTAVQGDYAKKWALIICATEDIRAEANRLYIILDFYYDFNGINYISYATEETVHEAFQWLAERSGYDDLVFIWIGGHGVGFSTYTDGCWIPPNSIVGGRAFITWDEDIGGPTFEYLSHNERNEVRESEIDTGHGIGLDVNSDGDLDDWVGIDEGLCLEGGEVYWDNDFRYEIGQIRYRAMVVTFVTCFSGGFIDDLSCVARRDLNPLDPILTSSNETWPTHRKPGYRGSYWGENYIDALWPEYERFDEVDMDNNGAISMYEAYNWAWLNDPCRQNGTESPWLDDNGDRRPTFVNEQDEHGSDGNYSSTIYLHHEP